MEMGNHQNQLGIDKSSLSKPFSTKTFLNKSISIGPSLYRYIH
jgi:hypothetical protein